MTDEVRQVLDIANVIDEHLFTARLYAEVFSWYHEELSNETSSFRLYGMLANTTYNALVVAEFLEIYKIYDTGGTEPNMKDIIAVFTGSGGVDVAKIEVFNKEIAYNFDIDEMKDYIVKYNSLKKSVLKKMVKLRNGIYAHNDVNYNEIQNKYQIYVSEINDLLVFAEDFVRYIKSHIDESGKIRINSCGNQLKALVNVLDLYHKKDGE